MLLVAAVVLGGLVSAWVVMPMIRRRVALIGDSTDGALLDADARKRVALASLSEIEYDRIGGKLDSEDYQRLRAQLEREALQAMEAADLAGAAAADLGVAGAAAGPPHAAAAPHGGPVLHACGFANPAGSRFCSGCGARL